MAGARRRDVEQYTSSLARYLPGGILFASRNVENSNLRKLLRGLSGELFRTNGLIKEYCEQIIPDNTTKFVSEWESTLGIPDNCFLGTGTLEERRLHVLIKLASLGIQTEQDFIDLAALFGITVTIMNGTLHGIFPIEFPGAFYDSSKDARFTIIITFSLALDSISRFPYLFDPLIGFGGAFQFGSNETALLECLYSQLKPANCNVVFLQDEADAPEPPVFDPTVLLGLNLWLDAQDSLTVVESAGSKVFLWTDKSVNINDALQVTAARQPLTGGSINGFNALSFDGVDDFLDITFDSSLNPLAFTIFVVCKVVGGAGSFRSPITSRDNALSNNKGYILYAADDDNWQFWLGDGDSVWHGPQNGNRAVNINESVIVTMTGTNGSQSLLVNQALVDTDTSEYVVNPINVTRIGAGASEDIDGDFFFPGDIGEVILYNRILPGNELQQVHDYLFAKWAITLPSFAPTDIAGLNLWLDAQDSGTIIESSGDVSEWSDKSVSGNNAVQGTFSRQPQIGGAINSFDALSFDGTDDFLDIPLDSSVNPLAFTIFVVCKVVGGVGNFRSPITSREISGGNLDGYFLYANNSNQWQFTVGSGTAFGGPPNSRAVNLGESVIVTMIGTSGDQSLLVNQVLAGTATFGYVVNSVNPTRIGAGSTENPSGGNFFSGDIGEIILYDSILLGDERQQVHDYLSDKWGILLI